MTAYSFIFVVVGGLLLFRVATALSPAGRMAHTLKGIVGHEVRVTLCGSALPDVMLVASVTAVGVGLHLMFRLPDGGRRHLKLAQPGDATFEPKRATIAKARYVQLEGKRVPLRDQPALLVELA